MANIIQKTQKDVSDSNFGNSIIFCRFTYNEQGDTMACICSGIVCIYYEHRLVLLDSPWRDPKRQRCHYE